MDPFTHSLLGFTLAKTGAGRIAPHATAALVVASLVPDIDVAHLLSGVSSYVTHGGAWSHSLLGVSALGTGVAAGFWWFTRKEKTPRLFPRLLAVCLLGAWVHLLFDWITPVGVQLLHPFRRQFYALDWMASTDLLLLVLLLAGLLLPILFGLIHEEIGARRQPGGGVWGAWVVLTGCLLLLGGRALLHGDVVQQLDARLYRDRAPLRVAAFPTAANPFRWHGTVETDQTMETMEVSLLGPERGLGSLSTRYKPASTPTVEAALKTRTARVFLARARVPSLSVTRTASGWRVEFEDLRFAGEELSAGAFSARVELDKQNQVIKESLRLVGPGSTPP